MNQWSIRRKRIILSIIISTLVVLVGLPLFFLFYRAPTCFDGKQNRDETGTDCGGSCQLLCTTESLPLVLKGDPRILKLSDNTFEIVALIENSNINGEIRRARYTLKLYDAVNILPIKTIEGEIYVPKGGTFAIFEGPFNLAEGISPTRVLLEWIDDSLVWQKNLESVPKLAVRGINISQEDTAPRLEAVLENDSLDEVSSIDLTAVIFDETNSIFAASKTFVEILPKGGRFPIIFTWPEPFTNRVTNIEVLIRILPNRR